MEQKPNLPLVWDKETSEIKSLPDLLNTKTEYIKKLLLEHGAVLFKSFGIDDAVKLEACVNAFSEDSMNYIDGNSPRTKLHGKVYTSTEHPADGFISLHNELSYGSQWPNYLFFCCETPPLEGGNTIIANSRAILASLSENTRKAFSEKGIEYIRNLHGGVGAGPSWQATFETDRKEVVESYCRANDISFTWSSDNNLRLIQKRKAVIQHPESNEEVWFNQADQFHPSTNSPEVYEALMEIYDGDPKNMPQYATFGDSDEIPLSMLEEIRAVAKENTIAFDWEKGDLMLVDNILTAHGRTPYKGPRKILVSMSA